MKKYPLAKPYIGKEEIKAVSSVLKSGILSLGPMAREFEKQFARRVGTKYACAVSSGTSGLHLALLAAGIGPDDEIITSPFSFIASANAVLYVGAKPVFVDVDSRTGNIAPDEIERRITSRTKAILAVHIFGHCAEMKQIMQIAKKHNLKVIEDACEALGAKYYGKNAGTFGESAVFAFYANKQMTTGEGGIIVTDSKKVYELCMSLRNQGRSGDMQWLEHERLGYNYRMDEMSAAVGLVQLGKLSFILKERARIARWYEKHLRPFSGLIQAPETLRGNLASWFVYVVRLNAGRTDRDDIIRKLSSAGIATKPYLPSIHLSKFYREAFGYRKDMFPRSEGLSASALALPFYIGLTEKDVAHIIKTLL